jgi:hypothetical protein
MPSLLFWLLCILLAPAELRTERWDNALVMFAACVLVPEGLLLLGKRPALWQTGLLWLFSLSFLWYPMPWVAWLVLPCFLWSVWLVWEALVQWLRQPALDGLLRVFALGYWATALLWAACFLADIRPLGFDPVITGLTAAHFHLAGFVFTVLAYCLFRADKKPATRWLALGTLAGMPLVATGITAGHLDFPPIIEAVSASFFVGMAFFMVFLQIKAAIQEKRALSRNAFFLGAACLIVAMAMAGLYAWRYFLPLPWINIPQMKIWHGTLNTLGFGWMSLLAWKNKTGFGNTLQEGV